MRKYSRFWRNDLDTDFDKRLRDAEEYAARAARLRREGRAADANLAIQSLKDAARAIDYGIRHTVEKLDLRITNRFGFVTLLDDKIAENQHAIDDTSKLIESLGKFTLAHFGEIAEGDSAVYGILRDLSDSIDESRRQLSAVLTRLSMLLMVFCTRSGRPESSGASRGGSGKTAALTSAISVKERKSRGSSGSRPQSAPQGTRTSGMPRMSRRSPG